MTEKQKEFALEFLKDGNATEAAIRAGYSDNPKSAATQGSRLLKNVEIQGYINQMTAPMVGERVADAEEVCAFFTEVMRSRGIPIGSRLAAANMLARRWGLTRQQPEQAKALPIIIDDVGYEEALISGNKYDVVVDV